MISEGFLIVCVTRINFLPLNVFVSADEKPVKDFTDIFQKLRINHDIFKEEPPFKTRKLKI